VLSLGSILRSQDHQGHEGPLRRSHRDYQEQQNTEESHRANLLFNELHEVEPEEIILEDSILQKSEPLFGPAVQALLEGGPLCGRLHSERWWNMYEKIYLTAPSSWRKNINYLITKPNYSLEDALIAYNYNIDATLYPDGPTTRQAMLAACEEYDDAMAAQEIMNG
jgi:hypothetical protein